MMEGAWGSWETLSADATRRVGVADDAGRPRSDRVGGAAGAGWHAGNMRLGAWLITGQTGYDSNACKGQRVMSCTAMAAQTARVGSGRWSGATAEGSRCGGRVDGLACFMWVILLLGGGGVAQAGTGKKEMR